MCSTGIVKLCLPALLEVFQGNKTELVSPHVWCEGGQMAAIGKNPIMHIGEVSLHRKWLFFTIAFSLHQSLSYVPSNNNPKGSQLNEQ